MEHALQASRSFRRGQRAKHEKQERRNHARRKRTNHDLKIVVCAFRKNVVGVEGLEPPTLSV